MEYNVVPILLAILLAVGVICLAGGGAYIIAKWILSRIRRKRRK